MKKLYGVDVNTTHRKYGHTPPKQRIPKTNNINQSEIFAFLISRPTLTACVLANDVELVNNLSAHNSS